MAVSTLKERGSRYGDIHVCFDRIAKIASVMLNKEVTKYDVAMIHIATKMGRIVENPKHCDSFIDLVNYGAIAAEFATVSSNVESTEDDIAQMARKLAPIPKREEKSREENTSTSSIGELISNALGKN